MDGLKTSTVKKSKHTKEACDEQGAEYNPHNDIATKMYNDEKMDQKVLETLITDIHALESDDHLNIYSLLRRGVEKNFFSHAKKSVHFDITKLPNELKWKLYIHVKMTKDNNDRQRLIKSANDDHAKTINNLDKSLSQKQPVFKGIDDVKYETVKYEQMLKFNKCT